MSVVTVATIVVLVVVACLDIFVRSSSLLFSADEIINLDAVLSFYTRGDYTTRQFGAVPFDPAVSSGIAATWLQGSVFALGGSLAGARAATALVQLVATVLLVAGVARAGDLSQRASLLVGLALWVSLLLVAEHEQRIVNPGEVWGALYLALGTVLVPRSPRFAALFWGVAVWLCKIIYLPFAGMLMLAALWVQRGQHGADARFRTWLRAGVPLVATFMAPLFAWMLVIAMRYDFTTLLAWCFSSVSFVATHSTGATIDLGALPVLPGWSFEPGWGGAVLFTDARRTLSLLVPLSFGPVGAFLLALARCRSNAAHDPGESAYLISIVSALAIFSVWFFGFDPTRWGRHLLPAVYVSVALGLYCTLALRGLGVLRGVAGTIAVVLLVAVVALAGVRTVGHAQRRAWNGSYASACRGLEVLEPPCKLDAGRRSIAEMSNAWCGLSLGGNDFDEHCLKTMRARFLEHSAEILRDPAAGPHDVYNAGYVVLHVQRWAYSTEEEFAADFAAAFCGELNPTARDYLRRTRLDRSLSDCSAVDRPAGGVH